MKYLIFLGLFTLAIFASGENSLDCTKGDADDKFNCLDKLLYSILHAMDGPFYNTSALYGREIIYKINSRTLEAVLTDKSEKRNHCFIDFHRPSESSMKVVFRCDNEEPLERNVNLEEEVIIFVGNSLNCTEGDAQDQFNCFEKLLIFTLNELAGTKEGPSYKIASVYEREIPNENRAIHTLIAYLYNDKLENQKRCFIDLHRPSESYMKVVIRCDNEEPLERNVTFGIKVIF